MRVRLPQGPWFPWSNEFSWDRLPWQGGTRHEIEAIEDQRDLAALVEAAASTIGIVVTPVGFAFRPAAAQLNRRNNPRHAGVLYEALPDDLTVDLALHEHERQSCVDLWVYWSPDTGTLTLSLPGDLRTSGPDRADRAGLRQALARHAQGLVEQLQPDSSADGP